MAKNTNRDNYISVDVKKSAVNGGNFSFYITDKNTCNFFTKLVINMSEDPILKEYVALENASDYELILKCIKPDGQLISISGTLMDEEEALYQFNLTEGQKNQIGSYLCEFWIKTMVNGQEEIVTTNSFKFSVIESIINQLDSVHTQPGQYPIYQEVINRLEIAEGYEAERERAEAIRQSNELGRIEAEKERQRVFDANMSDLYDKYDGRMAAIEAVNDHQYERLDYIDSKNKAQDYTLACLFAEGDRAEVEIEGNVEHLMNSKDGMAIVNEIKGRTMVNLNKDADKELILNAASIDVSGQSVELVDGNDGGLVDVYLEGNTMVNVYHQDEEIPLIKAYTVETGNRVAFEGEYDGKARPQVYGNTLVNLYKQQLPAFTFPWNLVDEENVKQKIFSLDTLHPIDSSKTYTMILEFSNVVNPSGDAKINISFIRSSDGTQRDVQHILQNARVVVLITGATDIQNIRISQLDVEAGVKGVLENLILLEGDYTNKPLPEYFEGMKSSFEDQVVPSSLIDIKGQPNASGDKDYSYVTDDEIVFDWSKGQTYNNWIQIDSKTGGFKKDTPYTIFLKILEYTPTLDGTPTNIKIAGNLWGEGLQAMSMYEGFATLQYGYVGYIKCTAKFTADNTAVTYNRVGFKIDSILAESAGSLTVVNGGKLRISNDIIVLEGEYDISYAENYNLGKVGKYKVDYVSTGKNKLDVEVLRKKENLITELSPHGIYVYKMKVEKDKAYTVSVGFDGKIYNEQGNYYPYLAIGSKYSTSGQAAWFNHGAVDCVKKFTIVSVDGYLYFYLPSSMSYLEYLLDNIVSIQVEEGKTVTAYEPFKQTKKTVYLNSPLLKGDSIEKRGGSVSHIHRYDTLVLDGSENWHEYITEGYGIHQYYLDDQPQILHIKGFNIFCENYKTISVDDRNYNYETIYSVSGGLAFNTSKHASMAEWKTSLRNNPLKVVYELANPMSEIVSSNDNMYIDSYVGGHLDFDTAVPIEKVVFEQRAIGLKYLRPSTEYTIQFEADRDGILYNVNIAGVNTTLSVKKGINRTNITTGVTLPHQSLVLNGIGCTISNIVVTEATDQEFGYFKGMKSVGECEELEVRSENDNILDLTKTGIFNLSPDWHTYEILGTNSIKVHSNNTWGKVTTDIPIDVSNMDEIYLHYSTDESSTGYRAIVFYDYYTNVPVNPDYIYGNGNTASRYDVKDLEKITVGFYATGSEVDKFFIYKDIKIGREPNATFVEPKSQTQQLTHEPLRAVGDIKDRYVLIDGEWYIERNCGELSITHDNMTWNGDGGEGLLVNSYTVWSGTLSDYAKGTQGCKCDILPMYYRQADVSQLNDFVLLTDIGNLVVNRKGCATKADVVNWIENNPFTITVALKVPTYEKLDYNPFEVYTDKTYITNNSTIPLNMTVKNHGFNVMRKPNTSYTLVSNQGVQYFTTTDNVSDSLRLYGAGTMKDVRVLEGMISDPNLIPSHFSGMESSFEQTYDEEVGKYRVEVKTVGKNLWSYGDEIPNGYIEYIEDEPILRKGVTYTISCREYYKKYEQYPAIAFFNNSGSILGRFSLARTNTFTPSEDVYRVRIYSNDYNYVASEGKPMTLKGLMVEEGDTATEYEPYSSNVMSFYIDEPLRGIGNDRDRLYMHNGEILIERNCGSIVIDGSTDIYANASQNNTRWAVIQNLNGTNPNGNTGIATLNDELNDLTPNNTYLEKEGLSLSETGVIHIYLKRFNSNTAESKAEMIKWLQANPITVTYPLVTSKYEKVEYDNVNLMTESYNDATIYYNAFIPVTSKVAYSVDVEMLNNLLETTSLAEETSSITDEQDMMIVELATQLAIIQLTM